MGPITTIQFNDVLPINCQIILTWTPTGGGTATSTETIKATRTTYFQTERGTDAVDQALNYQYALSLDYPANLQVTRNENYIYVRSINSTSSVVATATCDGYITYYPYVYSAPKDIRVRSPYLFIKTDAEFDSIKYDIKVYEGLITDSSTAPITYSKTKQKIVPTQENVFINLSPLLREDLTSSITNFLIDEPYTIPLVANESKWVYVEYTPMFLFEPVTEPKFNYFYAIDGYIEASETQGLPDVLKTGFRKTIPRNSFERIFFKTKNIYKISYTSPGYVEYEVDLGNIGDTNDNKEYIHSFPIETNSFDNTNLLIYKVQYLTDDDIDIVYTFIYDVYDECKYDNYELVFKNKYGVLDTLALTKKVSKTLNVKSTDYLRSIVDYNGDFDITKHTNKQMSTKGSEEWTLNTDFLPEYMNEIITEAMLSEEMWLVKWVFKGEPIVIPVTRLDNSISYKTHLNDKLIQYTVKVKMSHDKINNIQ
jgi:hypothetical protein